MRLLDEHKLAEKAVKRQKYRLTNVCAKLSRQEADEFNALADRLDVPRGELIRRLILDELTRQQNGVSADPVLIEVVGIQLLLMNILKPLATGHSLTAAAFDNIVAEVHKLKKIIARKLTQEEK
jgi:hypothetical protein